jgi:hypothetical protein
MKAKLIKKEDDFYSLRVNRIVMATSNGMLVDYKLSKQNCDEIFGVVDIGVLALEECNNTDPLRLDSVKYKQDPYFRIGYLKGYNKAMELNDKLFTVEDIKKAIAFGWDYEGLTKEEMIERYNFKLEYDNSYAEDTDTFIQSLQQPTEIEVEIEQVLIQSSIDGEAKWKYRLDENGCLILKKL